MSIVASVAASRKRVTENEVVDHRQQRDLLFLRHRRFSERFETLLHMAHRIDPGGSRQHRDQAPRGDV
jgi:hypothetical protein